MQEYNDGIVKESDTRACLYANINASFLFGFKTEIILKFKHKGVFAVDNGRRAFLLKRKGENSHGRNDKNRNYHQTEQA